MDGPEKASFGASNPRERVISVGGGTIRFPRTRRINREAPKSPAERQKIKNERRKLKRAENEAKKANRISRMRIIREAIKKSIKPEDLRENERNYRKFLKENKEKLAIQGIVYIEAVRVDPSKWASTDQVDGELKGGFAIIDNINDKGSNVVNLRILDLEILERLGIDIEGLVPGENYPTLGEQTVKKMHIFKIEMLTDHNVAEAEADDTVVDFPQPDEPDKDQPDQPDEPDIDDKPFPVEEKVA